MGLSLVEQLTEEERRFKRFRVKGTSDVLVAGNLRSGITVNILPGRGGEEGTPPGPPLGACCYNDGTCDYITEAECNDAGGTFQGIGTTCEGVSCTGACCEPGCVEDTTPDGCEADGGTFQGFGTTCDPDPCVIPGVCCGLGAFQAFDGSDRWFLTKTVDYEITRHATSPACGGSTGDGSIAIHDVYTVDPDTCDVSCAASGGGTWLLVRDSDGCHRAECTATRSSCGTTHSEFTASSHCDCSDPSSGSSDFFDLAWGTDGYYPSNSCINPSVSPDSQGSTATTYHAEASTAEDMIMFDAVLSDEIVCV